jgi:hypothetical protein
MRAHYRRTLCLCLPLSALAGCLDAPKPPAQGSGTGARLSVDTFGQSDVVGVHLEVERVACGPDDAFSPLRIEAQVDLVDGIFPGQIELIERVYDPDSRHLGADLFVALEPGCYDVLAAPAATISDDDWTPSADCAVARADGLRVLDGQTTEQTLISQCLGDAMGALDTLVTLNHPPVVVIDFPTDDRDGDGVSNGDDGKFNLQCEPVEVCATVTDPDDDPVELVWSQGEGAPAWSVQPGPLQVIGFADGHRIWEQCATVVTEAAGSVEFSGTAWDLGYAGGAVVRIEELVAPASSHDALAFPIHTSWGEAPSCVNNDGVIVPAEGVEVHRAEGCDPITAEEWYCGGEGSPDASVVDFLCDGGTLRSERLYPACDPEAAYVVGPDSDPELMLEWTEALLGAIARGRTLPPRASRHLALTHVAMFEAINGLDPHFSPYAISLEAPAGAEAGAAAVGAAHAVMSSLYPADIALWDALKMSQYARMGGREGVWSGLAYGAEVGEALLALRATDGSEAPHSYVVVDAPGLWRPTPPLYQPPVLPQWGAQTPWTMSSASMYRVTAPPALSSAAWADAYTLTQEIGGLHSTLRTPEETEIALIWADGGGTYTPPGHWFEVAADLTLREGYTLAEAARLHALMGLAVADAGIMVWEAKYATNHVRPVTAIRVDGALDGNPATTADPSWTPLISTPPFPEWVSGHAGFSGAASRVLARFVGTDAYAFTVRAHPACPVPDAERSFTHFSEAADEAAMSRIYGGIHWIYAGEDGVDMGEQLADDVVDTQLLPL